MAFFKIANKAVVTFGFLVVGFVLIVIAIWGPWENQMLVISNFFVGLTALAIAMWGQWFASLFFYPELKVEFENRSPDVTRISTLFFVPDPNAPDKQMSLDSDVYYFRFRVKNVGNRSARDVEVFVNKLEEQHEEHADKNFKIRESFTPLHLNWSHSGQLVYYPLIPPDNARHCDLGHIVDPKKRPQISFEHDPTLRIRASDVVFSIDLRVKPRLQSTYLLQPGTYKFELLISASNAKKPSRYKANLSIAQNGERWFADKNEMLSKGVRLDIDESGG